MKTSNLGNARTKIRLWALYEKLGSWARVSARLGFDRGYLYLVAMDKRPASSQLSEALRPHRRKTYEENCMEYDAWRPTIQATIDENLRLIEQLQRERHNAT